MTTGRTTVLVTLTGRDRPGVTSRLFSELAGHELTVEDIEQVVIRGRLVLGVLLACEGDPDLTGIHRSVRALAADLDMDAEITTGWGELPRRRGRLHVTVVGSPLLPSAVAAIASRIAASGANIDRIDRLADRPVTCIELDVSGADPDALRAALTSEAVRQRVDVAVQRGGLHRRAMRLIVMDVDSTLISAEVIDLLAARAGCAEQVAKITASAMRGDVDFAAALRERVALLAGLDASVLDEVRRKVTLAPGARTLIKTLRHLGFRCGIVSGGFTQLTDALAADLGLDYAAANTLEIAEGKLTGQLTGPVIDRAGKAAALRQFAERAGVPLSQTVAVGDGANDLDMIAAAGMGIAFNAKQAVRDAADASVSVPYLDTVLYLLGVSRDEVGGRRRPRRGRLIRLRRTPCASEPGGRRHVAGRGVQSAASSPAAGRHGRPAFAEPDDRQRAGGERDVRAAGQPGDQMRRGRVVAHREHGLRVVRLLVDQVQQVLGARVVDPGFEAHRTGVRRRRSQGRAHLLPGLPGAPGRGTQHQVGPDALGQQPPACRGGVPAAAAGQRALHVADPRLTGRLGVPQHHQRVPAVHPVASLLAEHHQTTAAPSWPGACRSPCRRRAAAPRS